MCVVCGCANTAPANAGHDHAHEHEHPHQHGHGPGQHVHPHQHEHEHEHQHVAVDARSGDLHFGAGLARVSVPGISQARAIRLEQDVLGENNRHASRNRQHFAERGMLALNLVSSPGSGKTTLLCATIAALRARAENLPVAVIEGDQQTSFDADRIRATGAAAIQINTGKGCHLDAQMVGAALPRLASDAGAIADGGGVLFIENVGNLVCPALWDLGEAAKVVILSVTEGEDKPLKYPDMFGAARLMVLNKTDLLPHLQFDVARCIAYARRVNPRIDVLQLSATGGEGMDAWLDWIVAAHDGVYQAQQNKALAKLAGPDPLALLNALAAPEPELAARIAALEAELAALKSRAG
jgi:hydrogenase nickel incorporation protein HypB